ncbi:unnamed protein product [Urochloa decumbens]|uniref:F-box domain-containing protein n=1 Tax=Urochloa decumbens TaxID=240449 RepID=A0ABC9CME5_9POAL
MEKSATAGRTWTRRAAASPVEELVVWEILLVRLPAKALLRCRAVCRAWRRLTSADDFLLAHHRHQPPLPLVSFRGHIRSGREFADAAVDAFDLWRSPAKRHPVLRFNDYNRFREFEVLASCDGLLLVSLSIWGSSSFYICNPATRQWITLPSPAGNTIAGLYPHGSSGEYRVLYRKRRSRYREGEGDDVYSVLTVGSSAEPRRIGCPVLASPSIKRSMAFMNDRPPVLLHSCLHWGQQSLNQDLIVFDTVSESFRCISAPAAYNWACSDLFDMYGMLGVSNVNQSQAMVEVWVLQDYKMGVWSLKYLIKLPVVEMRTIAKRWSFNALIVSESGDMLVYCNTDLHLFHCSSDGKLLQKFQWDHVSPNVTGHWFKESLCRHSFLQNQDHGFLGQPRFFRGL